MTLISSLKLLLLLLLQGDVIIKKGSEGNVFYMIKEGSVLVSELGSQYADHTLTTGDYYFYHRHHHRIHHHHHHYYLNIR